MRSISVFFVLILSLSALSPAINSISGEAHPYVLQTGRIRGKVMDEDGSPLEGVTVYFNDGNAVTTDYYGRFTQTLTEGTYVVRASLSGYEDAVIYNVTTGTSVQIHMTANGWIESSRAEFADGTSIDVEYVRSGIRLEETVSPLLPQDEWFFVIANAYMSGSTWEERNQSKGKIWYIDINGDGTFGDRDTRLDSFEVALEDFSLNVRGLPFADFDNDGDYDIITARIWFEGTGNSGIWMDANNLYFIENQGKDADGHRIFADPVELMGTSFDMNHWLQDAATEDFDDDGDYDFVVTGNNDNIYYFENRYIPDGSVSFIRHTVTTNAPGGAGRGKDAGDINNDGFMDFVYTMASTGDVYVYYGDGEGGFSSPVYLFTAPSEWLDDTTYRTPFGLTVGDFNDDGAMDIVVNDASPNYNTLWLGDGSGHFTNAGCVFDLSSYGASDNFDVDVDGDMDILIIDHNGGGRIYYERNIHNGQTWVPTEIISYDSASHRQVLALSTPPTNPRYATSGRYVSNIHDTGDTASRITLVDYDACVWSNQSIEVQIRSSNSPDMSGASTWESVDLHDRTISTPAGRYIQYRVLFTGPGTTTPILKQIRIKYFTDPKWITGEVTNSGGHPVPGASVSLWSSGIKVTEDVTDDDGDYAFGVDPGTYRVVVTRSDYNPYIDDISVSSDTNLDIVIRYKNVLSDSAGGFSGVMNNTYDNRASGGLSLKLNLALDKDVSWNDSYRPTWVPWRINDGDYEKEFYSYVNAGPETDYMNTQWVAIDLGQPTEIKRIFYYMSPTSWQNGFRIAIYDDYNETTEEWSGETMIVNFTKFTWTSEDECPDTFTFEYGATFTASDGSIVNGWLPSTQTVTGRWIRLFGVYGNFTSNPNWHYYRAAEIEAYGPSLTGEFISRPWNTTDPDSKVSSVLWNADVPDGTEMHVYIRAGDTISSMENKSWYEVHNMDYNFGSTFKGKYIQYRVTMTSPDGVTTPVLKWIKIYYYKHPAWIHGTVTQTIIDTPVAAAKITATQTALRLNDVIVTSFTDGTYMIPLEYDPEGPLTYNLTFEKQGYVVGHGTVTVTSPPQNDQSFHIQLTPTGDWTTPTGNLYRTSKSNMPGNFYSPGVKWKFHIGGYAKWGVIYDVNKDQRNDLILLYGDRVVAKTPDDVILWVGDSSKVDRIIGIYDLDKNGIVEVVAANYYPARISIINGINGSLEYEKTWPGLYLHKTAPDDIIVDDFDGLFDAKKEMIIKLNDGYLRAWRFQTDGWRCVPSTLWKIPYAYGWMNSIAVGDVDLDGTKEVVVFNGQDYTIAVYNAEDGSLQYERSFSTPPYASVGSVVIKDLISDDERGNIILVYSEPTNNWYNDGNDYSYDGIMVLECNETTIGVKWNYEVEKSKWGNQLLFEWMEGSIADVDGDGIYEFVGSVRNNTPEAEAMGLSAWVTYVWNLNTGEIEAQFGNPSYGWEISAVTDIDSDPQEEIILQNNYRWVAIDGNETGYHEKWNVSGYLDAYWNRWYFATHASDENWFSSGRYYWRWYSVYGPNAYGDLDGDGINEIFLSLKHPEGDEPIAIGAYKANGSTLVPLWEFPIPERTPTPRLYVRDIGNLTGDSMNEVIMVSDDGYLYIVNNTGNYRVVHTGGATTRIWTADLDGQDLPEVLVMLPHETWTTVLNLTEADFYNEPASYPLRHTDPDHVLVDYDNDGRIELITHSWSKMFVYEWNGTAWSREWDFSRYDIYSGDERIHAFDFLTVGNFNGDEYMDVFFTFKNYSYSQPGEWSRYVHGFLAVDGRTHKPLWTVEKFRLRRTVAFDIDDDGLDEILAQLRSRYYIIDGETGEIDRMKENPPTTSNRGLMIGNADVDPYLEGIVAYQYLSSTNIASGIDLITGANIWYGGDPDHDTYRKESGVGILADVDGDGIDEVGQPMTDGRFYCIDDTGEILWIYDLHREEICFSEGASADLDADGIPEFIVGAEDGKLYVIHGNNGTLDWTFNFGFTVSWVAVSDVDNDSEAEILVSVADGYVYCLDNVNKPDLVLRESDVESVVNQPDGNIVLITTRVRNYGGITAEDVLVRFTDNDKVFAEVRRTIDPGDVSEIMVEWNATPVGNHTINITVDPNDEIEEISEDNNNFSRTIYVWPVPDMAISAISNWRENPDVTFAVGPYIGVENRLDVTIHNYGPVIAENFIINLTDNEPGQPENVVDSIMVTVGANSSETFSLYWTPQVSEKNMTHVLGIYIDPQNLVFESDEGNNRVILTAVLFIHPPDIILTKDNVHIFGGVNVPGKIGAIEGQILDLVMYVENTENVEIPYVGVLVFIDINKNGRFERRKDVYINIDSRYDASDKWSFTTSLQANTLTPIPLEIDTAPLRDQIIRRSGSEAITPYPLCIVIDPTNLIPERNENNFVRVGQFLVIPMAPELAVTKKDIFTDFEMSTIAGEDRTIQVFVRVRNIGGSDAESVQVTLWDNAFNVGTVYIDVPAVTATRSYNNAYNVANFTLSMTISDVHVLHVRLTPSGEEALDDQTNNDAEIRIKVEKRSRTFYSFDFTVAHIVIVCVLVAAVIASRHRNIITR